MRRLIDALREANNVRTALRIVFLHLLDRVSLGTVIIVAVVLCVWIAFARQKVVVRLEQDKTDTNRVLEQYRADTDSILQEIRALQESTKQDIIDNRAMFDYLKKIEDDPCPNRPRLRRSKAR